MHRVRLFALILGGACVLCLQGLRLGRTQSIGPRRITNTSEEAFNINPSISGDGRIVAFESTEDLAAVGGADHFRAIRANVSVDPATLLQMGGTRAVSPAVSQDGSRIAFASRDDPLGTNTDGNSEIFLYDASRLTQITNTSPGGLANRTTNGNFQPSISDDGRFIAFSSNRDFAGQNGDGNLEIFVFDSLSTNFAQLTNSSGTVGSTDAKISGNGNFVAYVRDSGTTPGTTRDLIEQPRLGGGANVLASAVASLELTYGRAISYDGARVVFSGQTTTNTTQVFLYDGRGSGGIRQITSLGARVTEVPLHPTISGDGSRISFATRRNVNGGNPDGSVELYLYDLPTATFSRITNAPSGATTDVISSLNDDGSIVAFNFPRVLSGAVTNSDLANNSEIYLSTTQPRPGFGTLAVLNGASLGNEPATTQAVAPDSIAVARGGLLANSTIQPQRLANGTFPTNVGGTTVTVNGRLAQIFFVSPSQVNFLVPAQTELGDADVIVTNSEGFPSRGSVATLRSAPGLFTKSGDGTGEALVLNSETLQEGPFDPSDGRLRLTMFATGVRNATQLSVTIGGQVMVPELVLASPQMPGLDEIHLNAPASLKGAGVVNASAYGDGRDGNPASTRFVGGDILINEVLADPPGAAPTDLIGDANHDSVRSSSDDEFVELVNSTSHDIDISGYQLLARSSGGTSDTLRHTFAAGTIVAARTAVVIFGGGAPNPSDPVFGGALVLKASTGGLSLSNTGGIVTLRDSSGVVANIFEYGGATGLSGGSNQSLTRSPDITGAFSGHGTATSAGGRLLSPGTRVDGTPFLTIPIARIDLTPISPSIDAGAKQQFAAKAFDAANQEVTGIMFSWQSSNPAVATIDQTGFANSSTAGTTQITAGGRGILSAPDTLTARAVQRVLTKIEVTPNPATIPATGAQQFTARGLDQFGNEITALIFNWESSATNVATIDQNGLASGLAQGQSTIKATTQSVSGTALLNVTAPTLVVNEVLADPPTANEGDANHDGTRDGAQDEFVELVNASGAALNISGWTLRTHSTTSTTETVRHTFAASTNVPAGDAMIVFGGGSFDPANPLFGCAQVVKTSTSGLSLTNGGLTILIRDAGGNLITEFSYGGSTGRNGGNAQSLTRSPDATGNFVLHTAPAAASGRKFSAGLKLDGTPFGICPGHLASVTISPASTSATVGQSPSFTAQAFDQFGRAMIGVPITFASDNTAVATIDSTTPNPMTGVFTATVGAHNPGTAHITASATDGTTTANSNQATLTVNGPALSINDVSANEGNAETTTFTFTVSLSQPAAFGGVKFDIATQDGTATTVDSDYVARNLTDQVIPAGAVTYSFDVTVNGDATIEPNETFLVNITNVSGASATKSQAAGTILNDDSPLLSVNDITENEGDSGSTTFTFTVSSNMPAPATGITFDIATANGTAISASGDYIARSLTNQTIPAGQSSYSFDVTVNGDALVEANESFFVNISNVSANASISDGQGAGAIQNDDTPLLVISQLYGGGGNAGTIFKNDFIEIYNRGTSTVDLAGWSIQYMSATGTSNWSVTPLCPAGSCLIQPGRYFLVQEDQGSGGTQDLPTPDAFGTIGMTTAAGKVALKSDVTALSGACPTGAGILDIVGYGNSANCFEGSGPAGAPGNTTADFRKAGGCVDTNDNLNDFFVAQPNPRNNASTVGDCKPEMTINDVTVTENNTGTVNASFTVSLAAASAQTVTVDFATTDGTAHAPADYQTNNGKLTFNPGDLNRTITVLVNGDTLDEAAETFFVNLSNVNNAAILDSQGQGTINDNDPAPSLAINDVSVAEGDSGTTTATFTVLVSAASGQTVTVNYATADNTATAGTDYQSTSGSLTFNPGDTSKTIAVTINGDLTFEPNETFFVNLNAAANASISDNQGTGTITNDDPAPPAPTFSINDISVAEGNSGTSVATFTVTLSQPSETVVTVDYATADGAATAAGSGYQSANGTLSFGIGETSKPINVNINGDTLVEPDQTFFINLTNATGGAIIGDNQAVGTIQNDDAANLVISEVYPGGGLSGATFTNDFIELYNRGTTTVDFSVTPYSVQFLSTAAATWAKTDLTSGMMLPGHYFLVKATSGGANGAALPAADATGTLNLTSTTAGKVALVAGTTLLTANCPGDDLTQPFNPLNANVADFLGYGGTAATANHCYEGSGPAAFTASNNTIADYRRAGGCTDSNQNALDFFTSTPSPRNLSSPANTCAGAATPNLSINDVTVIEGNSGATTATFNVSLSAPAQGADVSFDIATADGTATTANSDYVAKSLTNQIIPAGQTTHTFTVSINGDLSVENDESLLVNISNVTGANVADGQGQGTIQNDDFPTLSVIDASASEGDAGAKTLTFTVSLSAPAPAPVTFDIATQDNTATTVDNDYVSSSLTGQTIATGQQTYQFNVTVNGDVNIEPNETFFVNVINVTTATIADGQGQGSIQNDDSPVLSVNDVAISEGNSGSTTFSFTVTSTLPAPAGGITFDIGTADNTAIAGSDYVARALTRQTIAAGNTTYAFDVTANGDTLVEPNETFLVKVTNAANASIGDGQGQGTIQNDDVANLVISQVYGGGNNSGATYPNDFVEIFNRGTTTVDFALTPYSVQYAGVGSNFGGNKTNLTTGRLAPSKYFLVQESGGTTNGAPLPTADANGSINLGGTSGKVALVVGTTALAVSTCPGDDAVSPLNPSDPSIADLVGYGNTAITAGHCYEGAVPVAAPSNTSAAFRRAGGCTDTNYNAADAFAATPFPRNSSSPANSCAGDVTPNLSINDVTVTEGNGGSVTATFTVSLSAAAQGTDVSFDIATADGTATTANNDYVAKSLTNQIIPAGQTVHTFSVTINGDLTVENDENFLVNISNVFGANVIDGQGQGTIKNDDFPTLSVNDVSAAEGDAGTKTLTFTVSLSAPASAPVTFDIATQDNTATTADNDYVSSSLTGQTIATGQQTYQFNVTANGDVNIEPNETFFVNVIKVTNATIADGQGQGSIQNDDSPVLNVNDVAISEGNSGTTTFSFTVTSTLPAPADGITFDIATADHSAIAVSDYVARTITSQTIAAGNTTYTFDVTVNGDTLVELNETFFVNVTNATSASIGDGQGLGTIQNDDVANLVISQVYGGGNNSGATYQNDFVEIFNRGTTTVDFALTPYSVQYAGVGSTFGGNKTNLTTGSVDPGKYFLIQESGGTTNGAPLPTADANGSINLGGTSGKVALVVGTTALAVSTCPGDDAVSPFNPSDPSMADLVGYGNTAITAGHCYEGAVPAAAPSNTSAAFRRAGGCTDTNDNAADAFAATPFPRNSASPANTCAGGAPPNLSINDVSVTEGNSGTIIATFTVRLSAPSQGADVTFDIATQDSTATTANNDYATKSLTNQIIPAGQTTYSFSVTINGDTSVEPDETFFINVSNVVGATLTDGQGLGTIQHDDLPTLSIDDVSAYEGDSGATTFTFHVSLSAAAPAAVIFDIATADNSATTADNDYVSQTLTSQTIAQGASSFDFAVTVNGDTADEAVETFFVNVSNVSGAIVLDGQGSGPIQNDDAPPILSINDVTQVETNSLTTTFTFTVQLSAPAKSGGVNFTFNTADGTTNPAAAGSDYVAIINGNGSISQGNSSTTVSVTVNGDAVFEANETFFVNLTNVTGATATDGQGLGTITNDDAQPTISIADARITEGASGTALMTFTVTLTGSSQSTLSVHYATADSSATTADSDYEATSGTLYFAPGDASETFTVTIHGDTNSEGDEMFLVDLSSPSGATISDSQALGIIFMDDPFRIANVNTAYTENFDGLAQAGPSATTPSAWTRAESGSGANTTYAANNGGSSTGDTYSYGSTTTPADRALGGLRTGTLFPTVGAFYRNDTGSTINTLQISYTGEEWRLGNAGRTDRLDFQYSTSANSLTTGSWIDVDLLDFTTPNTTTTGSKDGNNPTNRTAITNTITGLSIAAGSTFWIRWTDLDATGADDGLAVDDFSITAGVDTPALSISDVTAAETNGGTTTFNFTVSLTSPAPPGGVTFTINTADGATNPANASSDYVAIINGSGSIPQNGTSTTVGVTVSGDTDIEPEETFFVSLSSVTGATVTDGQGLGTITNDDAPAASADLSVTKADSPEPVAIGNDITYTITVTNAGPDAAANAVLADTIPTNTTFRSITPPGSWTCPTQPAVGGTGAISCSHASFAVGSAIFTLVVRVGTSVTDGTVISNTASVSSSTSDPNLGSESSIQTTTVKRPSLVISQIYPGGGNAGATYTNDFIEIFNRGTTTVDFAATNYSLQYTGQAANFGGTGAAVKFDLTSGTIAPGQYFLVQAASGGINGVALPTPDAISLIAMSATAGKVALVLGTLALTANDCPGDDNDAPFNPSASTIVDFVGYGATAATANHCYEGSGPAPFSTSTAGGLDPDARSTIRTSSCTDTNNNSSDFSNPTSAPTARNKLTVLVTCP